MNFPLYDQLAFILPGGLVVATVIAGGWGWPWPEPGVAIVAGLTAVAYMVGHVNAALARWLAPVFLGRRPGTSPPTTWQVFGDRGFSGSDRDVVEARLDRLAPGLTIESQHAVAYARLQHLGRDGPLRTFNGQIGFYRNSATATVAAATVLTAWHAAGAEHVPLVPGLTVAVLVGVAYISGYRRFWRRFGVQVLRGLMALEEEDAAGHL